MSNSILIKNGSGKPEGILLNNELGFDKTNKNLYIGTESGPQLIGGQGKKDAPINLGIITDRTPDEVLDQALEGDYIFIDDSGIEYHVSTYYKSGGTSKSFDQIYWSSKEGFSSVYYRSGKRKEDGAIEFDDWQTLNNHFSVEYREQIGRSEEQKLQARKNIGAVGYKDLGYINLEPEEILDSLTEQGEYTFKDYYSRRYYAIVYHDEPDDLMCHQIYWGGVNSYMTFKYRSGLLYEDGSCDWGHWTDIVNGYKDLGSIDKIPEEAMDTILKDGRYRFRDADGREVIAVVERPNDYFIGQSFWDAYDDGYLTVLHRAGHSPDGGKTWEFGAWFSFASEGWVENLESRIEALENSGGSGGTIQPIVVDSALSSTSTNPVQNRVITNKISEISGTADNAASTAAQAMSTASTASGQASTASSKATQALNAANSAASTANSAANAANSAYDLAKKALPLKGGTMTGPLSFSGGDGTSAGKIVLSPANASQITDSSTNTIFGFASTNTSALTIGSTRYSLNLRGSSSRPTYNSNSIALYSDLGTISGKIIQGTPSNDSTITGMNRFQSDLFVQGDGNAPNIPKVAGFYLGKSQSDENRHMDIVSGSDYSYIDFNKAGSNMDYDIRLIANVDSGLTELQWGSKSSKILNVAGVIQQGGIAVALSTDITNIQDSLAQKQPLGNYAIQDGNNTFSGSNIFSKSNTFDGEQKFKNSQYCPTVNDTAPGVGCAFKASRGLFNQAIIDEIIMSSQTNSISFKIYSGTTDGHPNNLTEIAKLAAGALILKPPAGEGGQIQLEAARNDLTNNGIVIDTANGDFRIFGLPSSDGTSRTGFGSVLQIDPYEATIVGPYSIDISGNIKCGSIDSNYITANNSVYAPAFISDDSQAAMRISNNNELSFNSHNENLYFGYANRLNSKSLVSVYHFGTHSGDSEKDKGTIKCGNIFENGQELSQKYAPKYSYGTELLEPGVSYLESGRLYFVYE